jgi:hypothetical protein
MTQPRMPCASAGLDLHEGRQLLRSLWSTRAAQQGRRTAVCTPYLRPPLLCAHWHSASSPNNRQTVSQNCDHPHKCQRLHHVPVKHSPAVCWAGGRPAGWSSWQPIASRPSGSLPCGRQTTDGAGRRLAISRGTPRDDLTTISLASCGGSQIRVLVSEMERADRHRVSESIRLYEQVLASIWNSGYVLV